ncbi:MAG: phenylalanine--tRNA ligase subunit beta [Phycisphaerae bacterium]
MDKPLTAEWVQHALTHSGFVVEHIHDAGDTKVLDVELTSNRPDCQSHIGIARELAVLAGCKLQIPPVTATKPKDSDAHGDNAVIIALDAPKRCPYYSAAAINHVRVGPSPDWLVRALESLALRTVNNVVDITNYVLMLTGQPLHAFDRDRLSPGPVVIREALDGETMRLINGQEVRLTASDLLIADCHRPLALAGIMGGLESEIHSGTQRVLLESAQFDPTGIARTVRRTNISSDSSRRFERGVDPAMVIYARNLAAQMICELSGGELVAVSDRGDLVQVQHEIPLRLERFTKLIGVAIDPDTAMNILRGLEFTPRQSGAEIHCTTPSFRFDISREVDLIEELVRIWGYENVPLGDRVNHALPPPDRVLECRRKVRRLLAGAGWYETVTFTFVDPPEFELFAAPQQALKVQDAVRKANNVLRPSLLPGLLSTIRQNQNVGESHTRFFEIASVFSRPAASAAPVEVQHLAITGRDVAEVISCIELILDSVAGASPDGQSGIEVIPADETGFAKGACGKVIFRSRTSGAAPVSLGFVGLLSAPVTRYYDLRKPVAAAELDWGAIAALYAPLRRAHELPRFPAVRRDLSAIVLESVSWRDIRSRIDGVVDHTLLAEIRFVGSYRGKPIEVGKKSVTMELVFRDAKGSLQSEQVDAQMNRIIAGLEAGGGAEIRR